MNTELIFHDIIGENSELPDGPSVIPFPCAHMYSVPARSTPRNTTVLPFPSSNLFPDTCRPVGGGGGDEAVTVAVLAEVAWPEPLALVAVTTTSIVSPTSEDCRA